jgi:hypothetical protein
MTSSTTYRRFAQECLRLAEQATDEHREVLKEMAEEWQRVAEEADEKLIN